MEKGDNQVWRGAEDQLEKENTVFAEEVQEEKG